MSEIRDKAIEKMLTAVDEVYFERYGLERTHTEEDSKVMNKILSIPELAIVDREAKLLYLDKDEDPALYTWKEGQDSLVRAGWVKEIKDGS